MTGLTALKLVQAKKPQSNSPHLSKRQKLSNKLAQQIQLAKSEQSGTHLDLKKTKLIKDSETGESKRVEVPVKLKPWWWKSEDGKICITVRYGARVLEIVEGKNAIEADNIADVITSLQVIRTAVDSGELDARIQALTAKEELPIPKAPTQEKKSTLKLPFRNN